MATRRASSLALALAALAAMAVLAVVLSSALRSSTVRSRTFSARAFAPARGTYAVVIRIAGGSSAQAVTASVTGAPSRSVLIPRGGETIFDVVTTVARGPVAVRAVGAAFKPTAQVELVDRAAPAQRPDTRLVWSDEFNGAAGTSPSPSVWVLDVGPYGAGDRELESYTGSAANASLDGHGNLAIVARRQTTTTDGVTRRFTSARLETAGLFSAKYGLIEARMKVPAGFGLWSSFWLLGDDFATVGWPKCGEIDVMETLGQYPFKVRSTIHGPDGAASYSHGQDFVSTTSLTSRFHTYGISWRPGSITWLIDDVPYATVTAADLAPGQRWVFDHPFHLVLNLAVGGAWPGPPNAFTPFPATLLVDWVRVYE